MRGSGVCVFFITVGIEWTLCARDINGYCLESI